jgi:hypothetical protein
MQITAGGETRAIFNRSPLGRAASVGCPGLSWLPDPSRYQIYVTLTPPRDGNQQTYIHKRSDSFPESGPTTHNMGSAMNKPLLYPMGHPPANGIAIDDETI